MARFAVGAAAMFALCRADAVGKSNEGKPSGQFGHDDSMTGGFFYPSNVPPHDKCSVDCVRMCGEGLGRNPQKRNMHSNSDCQSACYAHSIETPRKATSPWEKNMQQGLYVQKVMSEYCARGACGNGLLQASAVQKHEEKAGEVYSPNTWKGDPRAVSSGWPKGCESKDYYCQEFCQNMYHKPTGDLGEHPGASKNKWSSDQKQCKKDCGNNFKSMTKYWDEWCTCYKGKGGDMHLEKVPGLLQEAQELEPVDIGSFMQVPGEL